MVNKNLKGFYNSKGHACAIVSEGYKTISETPFKQHTQTMLQ